MNLLLLGVGSGSWVVRGRQLGRAVGARTFSKIPPRGDLHWADLIVLVKRAPIEWADVAHQAGKPVVWDALDFWDQPDQNSLTDVESVALLHEQAALYRADLVLGATQAMADASQGAYLSHHARPGLTPVPVRPQVTTVAYEGTKKYLGRWAAAVQRACDARGWHFVINPPDLGQADLIVAFRDGVHDGWMCREWKSGVKIVNAIAAGRPIITQPCAAVRELHPAGSTIEDVSQLDHALDFWSEWRARATTMQESVERWPSLALGAVASDYQHILRQVVQPSSAVA